MNDRNQKNLHGLTPSQFRESFTSVTPPAELVRERSCSQSPSQTVKVQNSPSETAKPFNTYQTLPAPNRKHSQSFQERHKSHIVTGTLFGSSVLKNQFFDFSSSSFVMVREQEPARNPLQPSQGNSQPQARNMDKNGTQQTVSPARASNTQSSDITASPQPMFGRPTALGASPQPFARTQPQQRPANTGIQRQPATTKDQYAHLFLPISRDLGSRTDLHKPRPGGNPLSQLNRPAKQINTTQSESSSQQRSNPDLGIPVVKPTTVAGDRRVPRYSSDDDVFEIPKPTTWQPKAPSYPVFSSQSNSNPFYQPRAEALILDKGINKDGGVWDDRYGAGDPFTYIDTAKANEQLKTLFEGAIDDDEGKSRTRRRKKRLQEGVDDLTEQIKGLNVKTNQNQDAEEEEEEDDGTREGLKVKLLPHQIDGVEWMRTKELGRENGKGKTGGGILADDMGLGKTIQSIALILANPRSAQTTNDSDEQKKAPRFDKGTLVVAPLALIKQWEAEIKDRVDADREWKVCVHHGPKRAKSYKDLRKYDVVITTYATLSSEHAASSDTLPAGCFGVKWHRIILDEAHSIKNRNAKSTKAACALNAQYRWCLSGTPMQNNLEELQSLIHFCRIAPLDKLEYWRDQIARPMSSGRGGLAIKRLQAVLANMMKRRTKDVLKQAGGLNTGKKGDSGDSRSEFKLVKRTVEAVEADFTPEERKFYRRLESRTDQRLEMMMAGNKMSYASALVLLMRLRQACNHPRLIGSDLTTEIAESGGQTPRKKASQARNDEDDLVAMLGGLTVEMKLCDVCQVELKKDEIQNGALRCQDCQNDIDEQERLGRDKKQKRKDKKAIVKSDRKVNRRVIVDSDDEDEDEAETKQKVVDLTNEDENENDESDESNDDDDDDDDDNDDESQEEDEDEEITDSEEDSEYDSEDNLAADLISSTKIRHLLNILRTDCHKHKYIVFSVFTSMLNLIEPFLQQSHIKFVRYDGSMRNDMREASLNNLRHDPTVRVLLCSLRAGSLGLNLTAASRVVVLEPFWNPFVEEQAIDRVHRLNQTTDVVVYKLTIKDTVEARILELQEKKRALAKATVEGQSASGISKLSMAEMLKLFDHKAERDAKVDMLGMKGSNNNTNSGNSGSYGLLESRGERGESTEDRYDDEDDSIHDGRRRDHHHRLHRHREVEASNNNKRRDGGERESGASSTSNITHNKNNKPDRGIYSRRW